MPLQVFQRDLAAGCTMVNVLVNSFSIGLWGVYSLLCSVLGVGNSALNKTETCPHLVMEDGQKAEEIKS